MPKLNHVLLLSSLRSLQQYFDIGTHSIAGKYERIIGLSQMPWFILELQSCTEVYFKESCGATTGFNYRVGNAAGNMGQKTGRFKYFHT